MAKNSETLHRVAATFQGGRDPDQDAVIQWLSTLPKDEKGQLRRSVLKYHLQRALLNYIHSGLASSQSVGGVPAVMPVPQVPVQRAAPSAPVVAARAPTVAVPVAAVSADDNIPTLTDAVPSYTAAPPAAAEPAPAKKPGGLLRNRIKNSMNVSNSE